MPFEFLQFPLVFLFTFLGLGIGMLLAKISPEELIDGEKYFLLLGKVLCVLIGAAFITLVWHHVVLVILALITISASLQWPNARIRFGSYSLYLALAFSLPNFAIIATLIFLAGIAEGTLFLHKVKKNRAQAFVGQYWTLLLAILVWIVLSYHFTSWIPR